MNATPKFLSTTATVDEPAVVEIAQKLIVNHLLE